MTATPTDTRAAGQGHQPGKARTIRALTPAASRVVLSAALEPVAVPDEVIVEVAAFSINREAASHLGSAYSVSERSL